VRDALLLGEELGGVESAPLVGELGGALRRLLVGLVGDDPPGSPLASLGSMLLLGVAADHGRGDAFSRDGWRRPSPVADFIARHPARG